MLRFNKGKYHEYEMLYVTAANLYDATLATLKMMHVESIAPELC